MSFTVTVVPPGRSYDPTCPTWQQGRTVARPRHALPDACDACKRFLRPGDTEFWHAMAGRRVCSIACARVLHYAP